MYKCVNCKKVKSSGDDVYFVESVLKNISLPNCSEECAKETIEKEINILQDKINKIKSNNIIKEKW